MMMDTNPLQLPEHDPVNHPSHYTSHPSGIECLTITRGMTFGWGNALKYVWRADLKNGLEDLDKAAFYLHDVYDHTDRDLRHPEWVRLDLYKVAEAEPDPDRRMAFYAIAENAPRSAIQSVNRLRVSAAFTTAANQ